MPAGFLSDPGDNIAVIALADHQRRFIGGIGFEVFNGREKLLMPTAQKHPASLLHIFNPGLFVFNSQTKCTAVGPNKVIQKNLKKFH
jgi:hypothetical protein